MAILTLLGATSTLVSETSGLSNAMPKFSDFSYCSSESSESETEYTSSDKGMLRMVRD